MRRGLAPQGQGLSFTGDARNWDKYQVVVSHSRNLLGAILALLSSYTDDLDRSNQVRRGAPS